MKHLKNPINVNVSIKKMADVLNAMNFIVIFVRINIRYNLKIIKCAICQIFMKSFCKNLINFWKKPIIVYREFNNLVLFPLMIFHKKTKK